MEIYTNGDEQRMAMTNQTSRYAAISRTILACNWDFQEARESSSSTINRGCGSYSQVAISSNDSAAYGDYYEFGRDDICPAGFSVPTEGELAADTTIATTTPIELAH
jgi:hypothetical protein